MPSESNVPDLQELKSLAQQGNAAAQYNLGIMYGEGLGVPQNYNEAFKWFSQAAGQGLAQAQYQIGAMYLMGLGVSQDNDKALHWFRLSANQGEANAQYNLGNMYITGHTTSQDFPLVNPIKSTLNNYDRDTFITKLDASGGNIVYST